MRVSVNQTLVSGTKVEVRQYSPRIMKWLPYVPVNGSTLHTTKTQFSPVQIAACSNLRDFQAVPYSGSDSKVYGRPGSGFVIICTDRIQILALLSNKIMKNFFFLQFYDLLYYLLSLKTNKKKNMKKKNFFFAGILKTTEEKSRIRKYWYGSAEPDRYQNVTDPTTPASREKILFKDKLPLRKD